MSTGYRMQIVPIRTPLGQLHATFEEGVLCSIDLDVPQSNKKAVFNPAAEQLQQQLDGYFADANFIFDLPVRLSGTAFQQRVWTALREIPSGGFCTYGELAARLQTSARAIGNACRCNPVPIVIPCHRVVAASGIGGYSGETAGDKLAIKRLLLAHEGVLF